jgi:hypothetical protein
MISAWLSAGALCKDDSAGNSEVVVDVAPTVVLLDGEVWESSEGEKSSRQIGHEVEKYLPCFAACRAI